MHSHSLTYSVFTCACMHTHTHTHTQSDFDMLDYVNELREGCLEAYTGIAQGLKGEGNSTNGQSIHHTPLTPLSPSLPLSENMQLLWPEVPFLFQFMEHVAKDEDRSDGVIACCGGLLGWVNSTAHGS